MTTVQTLDAASPDSHGMRRFLIRTVISTAAMLGSIAAINFVVDPFDWNKQRLLPRIEADFALHDREVRLNMIAHRHPTMLVLGNSVSQHAFGSDNPALHGLGFLNAAVGGGSIREMRLMLDYGQSQNHIKSMIAGLDFSFTMAPRRSAIDWGLVRPHGLHGISAEIGMLLSSTTLHSSLRALLKTVRHVPSLYGEDGHSLSIAFERNIVAQGGIAAAARKTLLEYTIRRPPDLEGFADQYRQLLATACGNGTKPIIVILPKHAAYMEMVYQTGNWPNFVTWEKDLATATEHAGCPVELWDFTAYNAVTIEPVPQKAGDPAMRWFYELLHFKQAVGDMMLAAIYDEKPPPQTPASFGVRLTPQDVNAHLTKLQAEHAAFVRAHPEIVRYVRGLLDLS